MLESRGRGDAVKLNLVVFVSSLAVMGAGVWMLSPAWACIVIGGIMAAVTMAISLIRGK